MSDVSPVTIPRDVYKIFNVAYDTQTAYLLNPGGETGTIGGFPDDDSKRNQWFLYDYVENKGDVKYFTLTNQAISTAAAILQDDVNKLVGNPHDPAGWNLYPTDDGDGYIIVHNYSYDPLLVWTLADGNDRTPITVEAKQDPLPANQAWTFVSQESLD